MSNSHAELVEAVAAVRSLHEINRLLDECRAPAQPHTPPLGPIHLPVSEDDHDD